MISLSYCDQSFALPLGCHPYRDRAHGRYVVQLYYLKSTGAESPKCSQLRWAGAEAIHDLVYGAGKVVIIYNLTLSGGSADLTPACAGNHNVDLSGSRWTRPRWRC